MKFRAWFAIMAMPILFNSYVATALGGDPYWQQQRMREEEAQSRLENERRLREHNQKLDRAMRQMQQMNNDSSSKTYYLGCQDPNDPSCLLDKDLTNQGRGSPPKSPPYTSQPYPPSGSSESRTRTPVGPNCEPTGLFGAPPQDCIDQSKSKSSPLYVGEGACRHNKNATTTTERFIWSHSRACIAYLQKVQTRECGCVFKPGFVPRAQDLYSDVSRSCDIYNCVPRVHNRVIGK